MTEHQAQRRRCSCGCETTAGFPAAATAPTCYGPNVKAYAIYLLCRQHIPQERCAEALAEMFGVRVSVGTLNNWLTEAAAALVGSLSSFLCRSVRVVIRGVVLGSGRTSI